MTATDRCPSKRWLGDGYVQCSAGKGHDGRHEFRLAWDDNDPNVLGRR